MNFNGRYLRNTNWLSRFETSAPNIDGIPPRPGSALINISPNQNIDRASKLINPRAARCRRKSSPRALAGSLFLA